VPGGHEVHGVHGVHRAHGTRRAGGPVLRTRSGKDGLSQAAEGRWGRCGNADVAGRGRLWPGLLSISRLLPAGGRHGSHPRTAGPRRSPTARICPSNLPPPAPGTPPCEPGATPPGPRFPPRKAATDQGPGELRAQPTAARTSSRPERGSCCRTATTGRWWA